MRCEVFLLLLLLVPLSGVAIDMVYFWQPGCSHCEATSPVVDSLENEYNLNVSRVNIRESSGYDLLQSYSRSYNFTPKTTPIIFLGDNVFEYSSNLESDLRFFLSSCSNCSVKSPVVNGVSTLTLGALVTGAIVDSINPCEFAVLILLISSILTLGSRKTALKAGLSFAFAIFLMYFLMGLGLFAVVSVFKISGIIFNIVAVLAIIIGLLNVKDFFWYGKGVLMEVPLSWRPAMKRIISATTSPKGAFLTGVVVALFLTPCTSGPYIVIVGLLSNTATMLQAIPLLVLYNVIFVSPMILLTLLFVKGVSTQKAERVRQKRLRLLHLIAGVLMIGLGALMLSGFI